MDHGVARPSLPQHESVATRDERRRAKNPTRRPAPAAPIRRRASEPRVCSSDDEDRVSLPRRRESATDRAARLLFVARSPSATVQCASGERLAIRFSTDPETGVASGVPEAAICVQDLDVQCVLQFTLINAAGCALHRRTNRVIHRQECFSRSSSPSKTVDRDPPKRQRPDWKRSPRSVS